MRVIAGTLGGRLFASPHSARTHPMSDRVRGALFNSLGDIAGLTVLDAFAGSGALGYEAASRGAASVLLLDNDKAAQRAIRENISALRLQAVVRLIAANCASWSQSHPVQLFDIVLLDPPYDHLQPAMLAGLTRHVRPGGSLVISWPGKRPLPAIELELLGQKTYGDAQLLFYRRAETASPTA